MSQESLEELLSDTLGQLEWRLRRLEFVLDGSVDGSTQTEQQPSNASPPVLPRVHKLEQSFQQLAAKSEVARELFKWQQLLPDVFVSEPPVDHSSDPDAEQQLAMVLAEAPAYSEVASQLRHLHDLPVPNSEAFAKLVALQPRMTQLQWRQYSQAMEISDLRKRSGALLLQWHELFILGQGRCWADWDARLRKAERSVRREEVRRSQDG